MPLLYFWRRDNYENDLDFGVGYHLNQSNPRLHDVDLGDSLWAFTRDERGRYVLAAELVVRAKTRNPPSFRYGPYRLWGDLQHSRYFRVADAPSAEHVIRALSVRPAEGPLGRSFQGRAAVRQLRVADHQVLHAFADALPLEPRARVIPEERLEAAAVAGDPTHLHLLLRDEDPGLAAARRAYLYGRLIRRTARLMLQLREIYEGRCQVCEWRPTERYGAHLCEGHHLNWLSRGGSDRLTNMVLLCPNHHRAVHRCDAPFDHADRAFVFEAHREPLRLNRHVA